MSTVPRRSYQSYRRLRPEQTFIGSLTTAAAKPGVVWQAVRLGHNLQAAFAYAMSMSSTGPMLC